MGFFDDMKPDDFSNDTEVKEIKPIKVLSGKKEEVKKEEETPSEVPDLPFSEDNLPFPEVKEENTPDDILNEIDPPVEEKEPEPKKEVKTPSPAPVKAPTSAPKNSGNALIIGDGFAIEGDITGSGNVFVYGKVNGHIQGKDITVEKTGVIEKGVDCDNIYIKGGTVLAGISANGNVTVDKDCYLEGDVSAKNLSIDGKVKGTATVSGAFILKKDASFTGNIVCNEVSLEKGSVFSGTVSRTGDETNE